MDVLKHSVLLERKGDYLILEYGRRVILDVKESFATVATRGAAGMNELIGLFLGWGVPFVVCPDDDKAGKTASANYRRGWALTEKRVFTLASVAADLKGKRIEAFLEPSDMQIIAEHFGVSKPSKSQVQLFFSEMLARRQPVALSPEYSTRVGKFEKTVSEALAQLAGGTPGKLAQRLEPCSKGSPVAL